MLSLGLPYALLLLPLPLAVWRFAPPHRERVKAIRVPFFRLVTEAVEATPRPGAVILRRGPGQMIAAALVWCLIVLGLARPERLGEPVTIETAARDIVIALDISGSMDERDFVSEDGSRVQRLAAVKRVMSDFIAMRDSDRMALIVFGTKAYVQAPFTEDLASLQGFLDQTVVGMAGPNTAIGDAIGLAIRTFEASDVDQRLLILLSDGADTSSRMTPVNAAEIAASEGVTIQTIGVGDPQASGEDRVDLAALEDIARRTGGAFFYAGDEAALSETYALIDAQNPRLVDTTSFRPKEDLAHLPFGAAVALVLAAVLVMHLRARRRIGAR